MVLLLFISASVNICNKFSRPPTLQLYLHCSSDYVYSTLDTTVNTCMTLMEISARSLMANPCKYIITKVSIMHDATIRKQGHNKDSLLTRSHTCTTIEAQEIHHYKTILHDKYFKCHSFGFCTRIVLIQNSHRRPTVNDSKNFCLSFVNAKSRTR